MFPVNPEYSVAAASRGNTGHTGGGRKFTDMTERNITNDLVCGYFCLIRYNLVNSSVSLKTKIMTPMVPPSWRVEATSSIVIQIQNDYIPCFLKVVFIVLDGLLGFWRWRSKLKKHSCDILSPHNIFMTKETVAHLCSGRGATFIRSHFRPSGKCRS